MTNYSKRKAILLTVLLLAGFCVFAQDSKNAAQSQQSQTADEKNIMLDQGAAGANPQASRQSSGSSVFILLRIIVALALVGAGIYGVVYLLKKTSRMDGASDKFLKSVAALPLAPNRSIQVITAGNQAFLVGITEKNISLISELTDKELIDAMNLEAGKKTPVPGGNFAALVASLMPKGKKHVAPAGAGSEPESAVATAEFLRRQRERLSGGFQDSGTRGRDDAAGVSNPGEDRPE